MQKKTNTTIAVLRQVTKKTPPKVAKTFQKLIKEFNKGLPPAGKVKRGSGSPV